MTTYNRKHPYLSQLTERYTLTSELSGKLTMHMTLDLKGSGFNYRPGDSIAVFPKNYPEIINRTIEQLKDHTDTPETKDYLCEQADLMRCSKRLIQFLSEHQSNKTKKSFLENLLLPESKEQLKAYLESHFIWDLLLEHQEVKLSLDELKPLLFPLLPRFYSIASSQSAVGETVDLTVALTQYTSNGHQRFGLCSHYLCGIAPLHERSMAIYHQPTRDFLLPDDDTLPIIMIGPGTGVAPFRAFMQERTYRKATGKNWLFFGEWREENDFYYQDDWKKLISEGRLRLDTAFSRDQDHKIYVQDRMKEQAKDFYSWLEEGAIVYVCGDASKMAKDVDRALHEIIQQQENCDEESAREYVKELRKNKRYIRDVY